MQDQNSTLFRQEVLDAKRGEWLGSIQLSMPIPYRVLAAFSFRAPLILVAVLIFGQYTRHEQARGELVPSAGLLAITASSAGTVARTLVREGDTVTQDQPLVEISTELDSAVLGKTREAISEQLRTQHESANGALYDHEQLTSQKEQGLKSCIGILRGQLHQWMQKLVLLCHKNIIPIDA